MTIAMLLSNTLKLTKKAMRKEREMKECLGEFKGMSKDEIIDTYDDMVERLLGRVNEMHGEIDRLKKEISGNGMSSKVDRKRAVKPIKAKNVVSMNREAVRK